MKFHFLLLPALAFLVSCEEEVLTDPNNYSPEINFEISEWVMKGKNVTCIDFDNDGNAWIASGNELIFYDNGRLKTYEIGSVILDLEIASDGTIWLGTKENGLARFSGNRFSYYTVENSGLPRNYVHSLGIDLKDNVWFCSAAHDLGGLMSYDGKRFTLLSPENSILNQHVIQHLKIDNDDNIYFNTSGKVGMAIVFRISNKGDWEQLGGDETFYWISALDVNSKGEIIVMVDFSLSSFSGHQNFLTVFNKKDWKRVETDFEFKIFSGMFVDKRDYIWVRGTVQGDYSGYFVFDGKEWHRSKKGQIPEVFIKSVKVDENNHIWFCTNEGIFILNQ